MSNISYNKQEEAFELSYKLWDETMTVRFYVEDEKQIMDNLSSIAKKLAKLDGSRRQLAEIIIDEGYYEGADPDALAKLLELRNVHIDLDDGDVIVCFDTGTHDGYMQNFVYVELFADMFEITGWAD